MNAPEKLQLEITLTTPGVNHQGEQDFSSLLIDGDFLRASEVSIF